MAEISRNSLKVESSGAGHSGFSPSKPPRGAPVAFAFAPLEGSKPSGTLTSNDRDYDPTRTVSVANKPKTEKPTPSATEDRVLIPPDKLNDLKQEDDPNKALVDRYYDGKIPVDTEGARFEEYQRQRKAIHGPKDSRAQEDEDDAHRANDDALPVMIGSHQGHRRARSTQNPSDPTPSRHHIRRKRIGRKPDKEKAKLNKGEGGKPSAKGEAPTGQQAAYKNAAHRATGSNLARTAEEAALGLKSGAGALSKGSKILRFGTMVATGAAGLVVGTASLVAGVAVIGGVAAGVLAYKYGKASGEKSIASAVKVGGELLVPQEAREKFGEAKDSFAKGDWWDGLKKGVAGCDEVLGISGGLKWMKDQAVDFAKDPNAKIQSITSAVKTGTEAVSVLARDSDLRDKALTVAGNMAAGNDLTESVHELVSSGQKNGQAVDLVKHNPGLFGFGALPHSDAPNQNAPAVAQEHNHQHNADDDEHESRMKASNGWAPEPETG